MRMIRPSKQQYDAPAPSHRDHDASNWHPRDWGPVGRCFEFGCPGNRDAIR